MADNSSFGNPGMEWNLIGDTVDVMQIHPKMNRKERVPHCRRLTVAEMSMSGIACAVSSLMKI